MPFHTAKKLCRTGLFGGAALGLVGYIRLSQTGSLDLPAMILFGLMFAGIVLYFIGVANLRCPHCGHRVTYHHALHPHCPYCGKKWEDDQCPGPAEGVKE